MQFNYKIDRINLIVIFVFSVIATILTNSASTKFIYYYHAQEWRNLIEQDCKAVEFDQNFNDKIENSYSSSALIFDWVLKNKPTQSNSVEKKKLVNQYCKFYFQNVYVTRAAGIDENSEAFPFILSNLDYSPYQISAIKLTVNFALTFISIVMTLSILDKVKTINEGWFRLTIIFYLPLGIYAFFAHDYAVIASKLTKGFTYPTSLLVILYILYLIIFWVRQGFFKNK